MKAIVAGAIVAGVMLVSGLSTALAQSLDTLKDNRVVIHDVQAKLKANGFEVGALDGAYGGRTGRAFASFVEGKGLADAPLVEQLRALGIDLADLDNLSLDIEGDYLWFENGLPSGIPRLHYLHDWKSFEVGRYVVTDAGEEVFTLDFDYCGTFGRDDFDCRTDRARVQIQADGEFSAHVLHSFEVMVETMPDGSGGNFQIAEFKQFGGIKSRHPETGEVTDNSPRFTLGVTGNELIIQDNALLDVNLFGGAEIEAAKVPIALGHWNKVVLEVLWSPDSDGLFRYWVDGVALWERKGRNMTCKADGSTRGCNLIFKYGPYTSHLAEQWGELAETAQIVVRFRNMHRRMGDDVRSAIASLPTDFVVRTERIGGPTPEVGTTTNEVMANSAGREVEVNSLLKTIIKGARPGANEVIFNMQGQYDYAGGGFSKLRFAINVPQGKEMPPGLKSCAVGEKTTTYDDGQHRPVLLFRIKGNVYEAIEADCIKAAVNDEARFMIDFLLTRFQELATDMAMLGTSAAIQNEGLRDFMLAAANGNVTIRGD